MMNRALNALFFALMLSLASCNASGPQTPPLEGAKMGGAFTLTDQNGKSVRESDFAGRYRLIYFGYTFCPDVCPVDVQKLMQGLRAFEASDASRAARVQPLFISVDPKRDTPAALKQFVTAFHPRLIGLTGSESQIADVAKAYGVYFERGTPDKQGHYPVNHSSNAVLYGPKGEPVAIIGQQGTPSEIAAELARWVR
jgi:protein SCO1